MRNIFLKGIIFSLGFCLTIGAFIVSYAAWTNLSTRTNGTTIDENIWNEVINNINTIGVKVDTLSNNIPSGAVMAFNLSSCPTGWIAANGTNSTPDLRGEFIRGLDNGRGVDSGRVLGSSQTGTSIRQRLNASRDIVYFNEDSQWLENYSYYGTPNVATSDSYVFTTRPRNVALLYCIKQ